MKHVIFHEMIPVLAGSLNISFSESPDALRVSGVHLRWCITVMETAAQGIPQHTSNPISSSASSADTAQRSVATDPQRARLIFQSAIRYAQGNSRPALAISPQCHGGIIIKKGHYSDFIGPGAAVVNRHDLQGNKVVPVGRIKFVPLKTPEARQGALSQRVAYLRTLEEIARSPVAIRRSCQIVEYLCDWLGESDAQAITDELVASLVGVVPLAIQLAWRTRKASEPTSELNPESNHHSPYDHETCNSDEDLGSLEYQDANQRAMMQSRLPSLR